MESVLQNVIRKRAEASSVRTISDYVFMFLRSLLFCLLFSFVIYIAHYKSEWIAKIISFLS
jgi:hypothetical protein